MTVVPNDAPNKNAKKFLLLFLSSRVLFAFIYQRQDK